MDLSTITIAMFKARFYRDFYFANQNPVQQEMPPPEGFEIIQDLDITNAFTDAQALLNQSLFPSDAATTQGYLYLTAHFLCLNIAASEGSINSSGAAAFPVASRSAGSTAESYQIPDAYKDSAIVAGYAQTAYGQRYLSMVLPALVGNVVAVAGGALPGGDVYTLPGDCNIIVGV